MMDETREYLMDQRSTLLFQIERAKHHLAGLEADAIKIINSKASLPAADIAIITEDLAEHLRSEIEALCWAIDHIDHELEYLDGDDEFEPFTGREARSRGTIDRPGNALFLRTS